MRYQPRRGLAPVLPALGLAILLGLSLPGGRSLQRAPTLAAAPAADQGSQGPADGVEDSTPASEPTALIVSTTNAPFRVIANDGMAHLEYDLILGNVFPAPVTLDTVEVITSDGSSLLLLEGDSLAARIQPVFFTSAPAENFDAANVASGGATTQLPVGGMLAMVMDVVVPPDAVPERISHRITYALPADNPFVSLVNTRTIAGPDLALSQRDPIVLAPPVRGAGWFAADACCAADSGHRSFRSAVDGARIIKTEMFAYDWLRMKDNRLFDGDGSRVDQWHNYGADVVAAAEGTVVSVRDGMPDETPGRPPAAVKTPADFAGNNVVVQIRPDVWATYGHLQPGSIKVQVGDHVTTGQLLGLLGNSGNSPVAPHLHFQLSDGPSLPTSFSLPFEFDHYTLAGSVDPKDLAFALDNRDQPVLPVQGTPQAQNGTYALNGTIQDFP